MTSSGQAREWVGGRVAVPARIESMGDRKAELSLWVELPDLHVVGHVLEDPLDPETTFGQSLMRAMASPLVGEPRRPALVRVADPALAAQIEGFSFLSVEVGPTPELDRVVRSLAAGMGEGSYFSDPAYTADDVGAFFAAARAFWRREPWTRVDEDDLVQVEVPSLQIADGCVSIVGTLGEVRGFVFFPSYPDYEAITDGELNDHEGLYFSFDERSEVAAAMRAEVAEHGWTLPADDVYPVLFGLVDGKPRPVLGAQLQLATALMNALVALWERHPAALDAHGEGEFSESYVDRAGLELRLRVPHPLAGEVSPARAPTSSSDNPYGLPLAASERKRIDALLVNSSLHRVIGMFCAVVSVPRMPPTQQWLGAMMGELKLANKQDAQAAMDLMMSVYNHVAATLDQRRLDELVPEADDAEACREWARGYSTLLPGVDAKDFDEDGRACATTILCVAELQEPLVSADYDVTREDALEYSREMLADDAAYLLDFWAGARAAAAEPVRREGEKVGRNDPCPCGSGKKYKKCHGAS